MLKAELCVPSRGRRIERGRGKPGEALWKEGQSLSLEDDLYPGEQTGILNNSEEPL